MSVARNLPIGRKIAVAFGLVCLLGVILGTYSFITFRSVSQRASAIAHDDFPSIAYLTAARADMNQVRRSDLSIMLCRTPDCIASGKAARDKALADLQAQLAAYQPYESEDRERALTQQFSSRFAQYVERGDRAITLESEGKSQDGMALLASPSAESLFQSALDRSNDDVQLNTTEGVADARDSVAALRRATWVNLGGTVLLVLLSALIGWQLTRVIAPRIGVVVRALERLARKDFTAQVVVTGTDEIGRLGMALNSSAESVRTALRTAASGADTLSAAAVQISAKASQTAANARAQSGKTAQIAAAAQEMTATIGEISHNTENAATASRDAAESAQQGGVVMQSAAGTMEKIAAATSSVSEKIGALAQRSEEIGQVVSVIQDISEQTNLLALNAAIESARAGEHGRGFAVVAGEVRRLAERTKAATEEIAATIRSIQEETRQTLQVMQDSNAAVSTGIEETTRAHRSLESIIDSSRQVEQQIQLIASASTEQTSASAEISRSAAEISQLSVENTQGAEESVKALQHLAALAADLDSVIRGFRLEEDGGAGSEPARSRRAAARLVPQPAGS